MHRNSHSPNLRVAGRQGEKRGGKDFIFWVQVGGQRYIRRIGKICSLINAQLAFGIKR